MIKITATIRPTMPYGPYMVQVPHIQVSTAA